jgi:hypothetical protein
VLAMTFLLHDECSREERIIVILCRLLPQCRVHGDPSMEIIIILLILWSWKLCRLLEPSLNLMDFVVPFVLGRGRVYFCLSITRWITWIKQKMILPMV